MSAWGTNAAFTWSAHDPESIFFRLCSSPQDKDRSFEKSPTAGVYALTCPECHMRFLGSHSIVHTCEESNRTLGHSSLESQDLIYPGDVYYDQSITFNRDLPTAISAGHAFDHLPAFKWPLFVREFLSDERNARGELAQVFWRSTPSAPKDWLVLQAVDRLVSLPRFQVLADRFRHVFTFAVACCMKAARHIGSGTSSAMWYSACGEEDGTRCAYLNFRSPGPSKYYYHSISQPLNTRYPHDLSDRVTDVPPVDLKKADELSVPLNTGRWEEARHSYEDRIGAIRSIWDLPTPVRRRLLFATISEKDAIHKWVADAGLQGLMEWRSA